MSYLSLIHIYFLVQACQLEFFTQDGVRFANSFQAVTSDSPQTAHSQTRTRERLTVDQQDDLILQARVFTPKGAIAPSASTTSSAKSDPASDGDAVQGLLRESGPSRRLGRLPLGPRSTGFQGRQPDPRPRLIDFGVGSTDGQHD